MEKKIKNKIKKSEKVKKVKKIIKITIINYKKKQTEKKITNQI